MYSVLGDVPKRAFPSKLRGTLANVEKKISKELARGSHSPDGVPKSPLVKEILALGDPDRRAIVVSMCERVLWLEKQDASPWHAHAILQCSLAGKQLAWEPSQIERIAAIAKALRKNAYFLPLNRIVSIIERAETISPSLRASIKALGKEMRTWESAPHHKLAKRLSALL